MGYAERDGYRLHYEALGPAVAPPLLLIMGLGLSASAWHTLPGRLSERFRVIVFDNRGTGSSSASPRGFRIRDLADDAAAVLEAAGARQAFVFGISMGGMIATELALRHPQRVRALALGATFGSHWRSRKPTPGAAGELLMATLLSRPPRRMARLLVSPECFARDPDAFTRWIGRNRPPRVGTVTRQLLAIALHHAEPRLARIEVPTLVITGDQDRLVRVENSRRLARLIPGARLVELPGAGHAFPFERVDETVRALSEHFLAQAPRSLG